MSSAAPSSPPWSPPKKSKPKKLLRKSPTLSLFLALVALALYQLRPHPTSVDSHSISTGPLHTFISEEGKTRIRDRYTISAPFSGSLVRPSFKPGHPVTAHTTIVATLVPPAHPLLDARSLDQQQHLITIRHLAYQQASANLSAAQSALELASSELARSQALSNPLSLSDSDRDRLKSTVTIRSADLKSAELAQQLAHQEWLSAQSAIQPSLPTTPLSHSITAPISGKILKIFQENDTFVQAGTPILEIGDPADLEVEAEILSQDATHIQVGDPVTIEHWGGPSPLSGCISRIEPAAFTKVSALGVEEQRVIVVCKILSPPTDRSNLGDRFRVNVKITTWQNPKVLLIPFGALFHKNQSWSTFTIENGIAIEKNVQIGHSNGRWSEVLSGLSPNDSVIVHPPDTLKSGDHVAPTPIHSL